MDSPETSQPDVSVLAEYWRQRVYSGVGIDRQEFDDLPEMLKEAYIEVVRAKERVDRAELARMIAGDMMQQMGFAVRSPAEDAIIPFLPEDMQDAVLLARSRRADDKPEPQHD